MRKIVFTVILSLWPMLLLAAPVTVTWTDNSSDETGFSIERKMGTAAYAEVGKVSANIVTFVDEVASGDVCYRVLAFDATRRSAYSNEACVTVAPLLQAPSGTKVTVEMKATIQGTVP